MIDAPDLALRHSTAEWSRRRCRWKLLIISFAVAIGCRTAPYRAATLPDELRVPPTKDADRLDLSNVSGLGTGSSLIALGDLVEITITSGGEQTKVEPILARVAENGNVSVPLVGEVPVAGIEPIDAGQRIAAASVQRGIYRQPSVVIKVKEPAVNHVTVLGAVTEPGAKELPRGSSDVVSAVAAAGGFTELASTEVDIMRHHPPTFLADTQSGQEVVAASYSEAPGGSVAGAAGSEIASNFAAPTPPPKTYRLDLAQANPTRQADYRLGDGDIVMVLPEKDRVIHVTGLVNKPDQFKIPRNQDVRVLDAIALAGGFKSPVADKIFVIREMPGRSEPAVILVSAAKAKRNGDENLRLKAGDLVSVEATPITQFVDAMTTVFHIGLGLGGNLATF